MGGMEVDLLATLFAVAIVANCFDAIAGGGGLLTIPALLLAGLDPVSAIATNKVQGMAGSVSATVAFARRGMIDWRTSLPIAFAAMGAAVAGAMSVRLISRTALEAAVPLLLIAIAAYFMFGRRMREEDAHARMSPYAFAGTAAVAVGFYDGVFGPGAGSFYMLSFVGLLGYGVLKATAHTKLVNAASNIGSLALFALTGAVLWPIGLTMAAGSIIGAQIGSRFAIRLGPKLIRPLLVTISCVMAAKLLMDEANPLRQALLGLLSA